MITLSNNPYLVRLTGTWVVDAWMSINTQIHTRGRRLNGHVGLRRVVTFVYSLLHCCNIWYSCMRGSRRRAVPVDRRPVKRYTIQRGEVIASVEPFRRVVPERLVSLKLDSVAYISVAESIDVSSTTFTLSAPTATEFGEIMLLRRSRSSKVTEFGTNRKLICEEFPWDDLRKRLPGCQQMATVPSGVETLPKISIVWVGCTNVTDDRRKTDDRRWHTMNSSRSLKINC